MSLNFNSFSLALFISSAISAWIAVIAYQRRKFQGASALMSIMAALTWWSLAYGMENLGNTAAWHILWASIGYVGVTSIPLLWLIFALQYTNNKNPILSKTVFWLWLFPLLTVIMVWSNPWHHLMWSQIDLRSIYGISVQSVEHGPYFWIHAMFSYGAILAGTAVFTRHALNAPDSYRAQATTMLLAVFFLLTSNGMYIFGLLPLKGLDITPFTFTIASLILAWGLLKQNLLDLMPIATETILNNMGDGLLVTDANNRIIYINQAFENLAGLTSGTSAGHFVHEVLPTWPNIFHPYLHKTTTETKLVMGERTLSLEIQVSPILQSGEARGCIYVFRSIAEREDVEARIDRQTVSRQTSQHIPIYLLIDANDGKIMDVNNAFIFHTGYTREGTLGRTLLQMGLWDPETRTSISHILREKDRLEDYTIYLNTKDASPTAWKVSITKTRIDTQEFLVWCARPLIPQQS
ncbi:MAG: hypothetical protein Fur0035_16490 [Anaerolineales bacterium]